MKQTIKKLFVNSGGAYILRHVNKAPRVVFFHGVDHSVDYKTTPENIEYDIFRKEVSFLKKNFEIISIEEFESRYNDNSFSGKEVVLTFDDGYANNLRVVAPFMAENKLPFTVFVSTEHTDSGEFYPTSIARIVSSHISGDVIDLPSQQMKINNDRKTLIHLLKTLPLQQVRNIVADLKTNLPDGYYNELTEKYSTVRPMTWDEVKKISEIATIGSHCSWHICCHKNQDMDTVRNQIVMSKEEIEKHIGKKCSYFAYPNGDHTDESDNVVTEVYKLGFSTKAKERIKGDVPKCFIPRIGISANLDTFKIVMGVYPN